MKRIQILKQYENYNLIIFDQHTKSNRKIISRILKKKFRYFYSKRNIGLSKSTNFLISKVRTKFFLFTQADVEINKVSIQNLLKVIKSKKHIDFADFRLNLCKLGPMGLRVFDFFEILGLSDIRNLRRSIQNSR